MLYKLLHIGFINNDALEEFYQSEFVYNGNKIQLDVNFQHKSLEVNRIDEVNHFIENIRIHDLNNKKHIQLEYRDVNGEARAYIEHHVDELATDDLLNLVGTNTRQSDQPDQLLKTLKLIRVGLYPDDANVFAVFDYSIGKDLTDYVLVVNTDKNGNLDSIIMES